MKLRSIAIAFLTFALAAVTMLAADVNGKWTATVQGRNGNSREVTYNLKADGSKLTGTTSTPQGEREIENGKIDGDTVSWSQTMNFGGESRTLNYTGKVAGDEIKVTMTGGQMSREFVMKKAK